MGVRVSRESTAILKPVNSSDITLVFFFLKNILMKRQELRIVMELEDTKFNIFPWIKQARHNGARELSVKLNFDFI